VILFGPGPPTPPLHRRHPAVRELDRIIRGEQAEERAGLGLHCRKGVPVEDSLQAIRRALVGKPLRPNNRTGARARQRRLL
jgi:hypothetical protein